MAKSPASAANSTALNAPTVLACERKLELSDALLFAGDWAERTQPKADWQPVAIQTKSVRGTISNRLKKNDEQDPAKLDASIRAPNLQTVDIAALSATTDTLYVRFSLRILPGVGQPVACNEEAFQAKLQQAVAAYQAEDHFQTLAIRYAANLANGRFLWRNRMGAEQVEVQVSHQLQGQPEQTWVFDALSYSLRDMPTLANASDDLKALAQLIQQGLCGDKHVLLHIQAAVRLGAGQEVFPSQELILDKSTDKSKTLYHVNNVAALHSQKIGNAIRTIDTWHTAVGELGPIAVEPYGSVTTLGKACRQPRDKIDFYTLLDNWILRDKTPLLDQQHYIMAMLVRGGVFS